MHLCPVAVPGNTRRSRIDHVPDARDRQRGLRDVGGEHYPAPGVRLEHPVLFRGGQPRVQRHDLGIAQRPLCQGVGGVPDLAFTAEEHQDVAGARRAQFVHRGCYRLCLVAFDRLDGGGPAAPASGWRHDRGRRRGRVGLHHQRSVADLHRKGPAGDLDHGRVAEVAGEALRVDGRRRDDHFEVGSAWQELLQVAEDEVDVEAAFVGFIDDQCVVLVQRPICLDLGQQDAVGHQFDQTVPADLVGEPHLVADDPARLPVGFAQLRRDPLRHRARSQPARLGVTDQAAYASSQLKANFRQLCGLSGAGLTGEDHNLMVADRGEDVVLFPADR